MQLRTPCISFDLSHSFVLMKGALADFFDFRQKFYKLKKESEALLVGTSTSAATTPASKVLKFSGDRKRKNDDAAATDGTPTPTPAAKRQRGGAKKKADQITEPVIKDEEDATAKDGAEEKKVEAGVEGDEKEEGVDANAD
jgi:hypothetical protein